MSFDVHRLVGLGRVGSFDRSPDGTWLAVEVGRADDEAARYRSELWRVPLDGTEPTRIAQGAFHDAAPRFRSDGALLFLSNRTEPRHKADDKADPDTATQVWALGDRGLVRLTDEPLGVAEFRVADGGRLVLLARALPGVPHAAQRSTADDRKKRGPSLLHYRDMPVRFWDHWLGDARARFVRVDPDGARAVLTPDADREYEHGPSWDLSRDGRTVVTTHARTGALRVPLRSVAVIDAETGGLRELGREEGVSHDAIALSPSGRRIATVRGTLSSDGIGRQILHLFDLDGGAERSLTDAWDRWPVPVAWLDEDAVLCTADDRGSVPIFRVDTRDGAVAPLTPPGSHAEVRVGGGRVWAVRHAILEPPEVVSVPAEGGEPTWHTALAGIDRAELSELAGVEEHDLVGTDGATVPLFVVRPKAPQGRHPLLLWIHGGPMGQWGQTWHWRWNALVAVSAGYVVGLPNPRGSTGLGQDYVDAIQRNTWGGQCYEDVMVAADALVARDDVDPTRTCAMGGSFGGYMTNWIGTQTDRFGCLITHASLFSFHQFGWTTDLPAWWAIELAGNPWDNRDFYERYSPDMHMRGWTSPVLVIHGDKDYRVPIGEGLALFEALQVNGVDAELAVFPDENHWILKPRNVVAWYELVLDYLDRKIGGA